MSIFLDGGFLSKILKIKQDCSYVTFFLCTVVGIKMIAKTEKRKDPYPQVK